MFRANVLSSKELHLIHHFEFHSLLTFMIKIMKTNFGTILLNYEFLLSQVIYFCCLFKAENGFDVDFKADGKKCYWLLAAG